MLLMTKEAGGVSLVEGHAYGNHCKLAQMMATEGLAECNDEPRLKLYHQNKRRLPTWSEIKDEEPVAEDCGLDVDAMQHIEEEDSENEVNVEMKAEPGNQEPLPNMN